jgi:hypothetical protein
MVIPASVTTINDMAFYGATSLTNFYFQGNAPSLGNGVFDGDPATINYRFGATGWGTTFGGLPVAPLGQPPFVSTAFSPNNIAVLRVQDNSGVLTNVSAGLFLDEYATNGSFVQEIAIPTNGANALVVSGDAVAEVTLTRSLNGRWLCFSGYRAPVGVLNIPGTSSLQYPRELATVDVFGNFSVVSANTNFFNGLTIRGAVTDGTNNFWAIGAISGISVGGLDYYGYAGAAATVYSQNIRVANLVNGRLYLGTSSGGGIYEFTGLPEAAATPTRIIATGSGSSPYGFAINSTGNIVYVADDRQSSAGGIQRWTNSTAGWSLVYTLGTGIANTGARGLAVDWSGPNPILYASTSENTVYGNPANRLIRIVDTGAGSIATTFATAGTNSSFRGVAFVPQAIGPQSQIQGVLLENADMRVYWEGIGGSNYVVQTATNLSAINLFNDVSPVISLPGTGVVATNYLDAGAVTNSPSLFYRIRSN